MDKAFYKEYYHLERKHWWFKVRAMIIRDQLLKLNLPSGTKILNVGAATFRSSELLSEFGEVTSLEYDEDCCDFVRNDLKQEVVNGSVLELQFEDKQFDLVCAFDVVEHVEFDDIALQEMRRVCKDEGAIFITVPAFKFLWSPHDELVHHYRRYTMSNLMQVVDSPKDRVIRKTYFNSLLFLPITAMRLLGNLFRDKSAEPKSDFETVKDGSILNKMFEMIFSVEKGLLKVFNFPVGVSIMVLFRNKIKA